MKKAFFLAAALVAMVGCNKTIIESPVANEADYGYINFDVTADTEMVVTKGMTADDDLNAYRICLYKVEVLEETTNEIPYWAGNKIGENTTVPETGFITIAQARNNAELWKVPAGSYKIFVENAIENNLYSSKGSVYLSDEKPVTVYAGLPATVELTCTPKNSKVSFIYTDEFDTVFKTDDLSVSVKEDNRTVNLTPTHVSEDVSSIKNDLDAAYFHAGKTLTWTMSVSTTADNAESVEYTSDFTTVEGKWTIVTFSTGTTDGTINVTVTVNGEITETETITYTFKPATGEVDKN